MINSNTLRLLNREGIGVDVDKLESYLIDLKHIQIVSRAIVNSKYYMTLVKILKELKPESLYFTDKTSLVESNLDKQDSLFVEFTNDEYCSVFGYTDSSIDAYKEHISSSIDEQVDLIAIPNIQGLCIKILFINGYIYRINLIGKQYKYTDITDKLKNRLPKFIEEFSAYEIVELRGYIVDTVLNDELSDIKYICGINNKLRTNTEIDSLNIVIDEVHIKSDKLADKTQWELMDIIDIEGLNVANRMMIRGVTVDTLNQALKELEYNIKESYMSIDKMYRYNGIKVIDNSTKARTYENTFIHNINDAKENSIFTGKIKSVINIGTADDLHLRINIVDLQCNDNLILNYVDVFDISKLDNKDMGIGKEIKFVVINRECVII